MSTNVLHTIKPTKIIAPPFALFGTNPKPNDAKWFISTYSVSADIKPTPQMLANIPSYSSDIDISKINSIHSADEYYFHYELYGHQNAKIPPKKVLKHIENNKKKQPMSDLDITTYPVIGLIQYKMCSPTYHLHYKQYQEYLYKVLQKNTFKSQHELNYNYTLFIHCVTNPNGPQIWRKVSLNGRLTLKQVDKLLSFIIGYAFTGRSHMTEFRINFNNNKITDKIPLDLWKHYLNENHIRNELVIFDTEHDEIDRPDCLNFRHMRANCTAPMDKIYLGQIAELFLNKQSLYTNDSIPFDTFYDKYYGNLYPFPNQKRYKFVNAKHNFSFNRNDCFQFVYDWGEEWIYNIYVIDKQKNNNNKFLCKLIDGKTMCPPNDIGAMEAYKWCVKKCHYDPYALNMEVGDFKTPNDVYDWMKGMIRYYNYQCLMGDNGSVLRSWLIHYFQKNYKISAAIRKKIVRQLNSKKPFWFPYREMLETKSWLDGSCKIYMEKWVEQCRKYRKRNNECKYCGNKGWKIKLCSKCKLVMYCSRKCQKKHWISHKHDCISF